MTRQAILSAARDVFGSVGFERATIRSIAAGADVDPGLVHHYFGTKQGLFAAAHELPFDPVHLIEELAAGPRDELGVRITRFYLTVVGSPGSPAASIIRGASTNEAAARMLREFIEDLLLSQAEKLTDARDPRLRMALVGAHMIGVIFARTIVEVSELVDADYERLVSVIAPVIQHYLTAGDLAAPIG